MTDASRNSAAVEVAAAQLASTLMRTATEHCESLMDGGLLTESEAIAVHVLAAKRAFEVFKALPNMLMWTIELSN